MGDEDQSFIVDANRSSVTSESEFGDGIETREDGGYIRNDFSFCVERKPVTANPFNQKPSPADKGRSFPITGAQGLEN